MEISMTNPTQILEGVRILDLTQWLWPGHR